MESLTTKGIQITVRSAYEQQASNPAAEKYVFTYHISILNTGSTSVQLINRHWIITDADNVRREVKGPGVIGEQPVIHPGDEHSYDSWSVLRTPVGKMYGSYEMIDINTDTNFEVKIPAFKLIADFVFN